MAGGKIRGITIELGGDTSKFVDSIKKADKAINDTQKKLKDVNKLLKLDPGNSDLLKQKQDALGKAIEQTGNKSKALKEALKEMEQAGITDENREQYEALQRELVETKDKLDNLKKESKNFGSVFAQQVSAAGEKVKELGGKITDVGKGMSVGITAPIAGVAAASVVAWKEVDAGLDIIVTKTGATGDALEDMQTRAQNIATTIPTSFEAAGTAIGEVNTRFGLTGDALEQLSTQFIQFAEINGTDVNASIDSVQQVLSAFGLSANDAGAMLDTLNKVGQDTGINLDQLSALMVSNATAFQGFGLNAADAANVLGTLEKAGIDTSVVMTGMSKVQVAAMKDGVSMTEAFNNALSSSDSAIEIFGAKAGPKLYAAFENGTLSAEMFTESQHNLSDALGSTADTFNGTLDPLDQTTVIMNQLKVVGADLVNTVGPMLANVLQKVSDVVKSLTEKWNGLTEGQKTTVLTIAGILAAIGPLLTGIGSLVTLVGSIMTIAPAISGVLATLTGPIGLIIAAVAALAVAVFTNWESIKTFTLNLWTSLTTTFTNLWTSLTTTFTNIWTSITTTVTSLWTTIQTIFTTIALWISQKVEDAKTAATNAFTAMHTAISTTINNLKTSVTNVFTAVKNAISTAITTAKTTAVNLFESMKTGIGEKIDAIKTAVGEKFEAVKTAIKNKLDAAWEIVKGIVDKIKGAFNFEWKLPELKVPTVKVVGGEPPYGIGGKGSLPHFEVTWNKRGYFDGLLFNEPTVLPTAAGLQGFGDGNGAELVIGLNRLQQIIGDAVGNGAANNVNINVYAAQGMSEAQVANAVAMKLDRWLGGRL